MPVSILFFRMAAQRYECAICLQDMLNRRPKALPVCLHTFCAACIKSLILPYLNKITCPVCRKDSRIPPGGVENLPDNFHLYNTGMGPDEENLSCAGCEKILNPEESRDHCIQCEIDMCHQCSTVHERRFAGKHQIEKILTSNPEKEKCKEHRSANIQHYCLDCDEIACPQCVLYGLHKNHKTTDAKDYICNQRVIRWRMEWIQFYAEKVDQCLGKTLEVKDMIRNNAEALKLGIDKETGDMIKKITKAFDLPLEDAGNTLNRLREDLNKLKNTTEMQDMPAISRLRTMAEVNTYLAQIKTFEFKTPSFIAQKKVHIGTVNTNINKFRRYSLLADVPKIYVGLGAITGLTLAYFGFPKFGKTITIISLSVLFATGVTSY